MSRGYAVALVGANFGSEGKGLAAAALAHDFNAHVRSGGPNAGHTFYKEDQKFVARSVPVGWINENAQLFIGPGAVLDLDVLYEEVEEIEAAGFSVRDRLLIDGRATIISETQHLAEGGISGDAHQLIGSTGEGVGMARMARINRRSLIPEGQAPYTFVSAQSLQVELEERGYSLGDVAFALHQELASGSRVLLEGTQGLGLSLTLGEWPYCTSTCCGPAQLAADAGISPSDVRKTILVARTYPIRVAGNSGPLVGETSWGSLGFEPEITTVTKKVRRVGYWNPEQVRYSAQVCHPASVVITFLDYLYDETKGITNWRALSPEALAWIETAQEQIRAPIVAVGTGPQSYCPLQPHTEAADA